MKNSIGIWRNYRWFRESFQNCNINSHALRISKRSCYFQKTSPIDHWLEYKHPVPHTHILHMLFNYSFSSFQRWKKNKSFIQLWYRFSQPTNFFLRLINSFFNLILSNDKILIFTYKCILFDLISPMNWFFSRKNWTCKFISILLKCCCWYPFIIFYFSFTFHSQTIRFRLSLL